MLEAMFGKDPRKSVAGKGEWSQDIPYDIDSRPPPVVQIDKSRFGTRAASEVEIFAAVELCGVGLKCSVAQQVPKKSLDFDVAG